jgi:methylmalonyl-CoA mutase cobalamin-binding subunit
MSLGNLNGAYGIGENAPSLITTTPAGQLHELGACISAVIAMSEGWKVNYLGPNMPAEEIAAAARQKRSKAVALSIIYPPDDPQVIQELKKLRRALPEDVPIFVGGRAALAYREVLSLIQAKYVSDMRDFASQLRALREARARAR